MSIDILRKMNAFIFAAGLGTRLKPFTESHPKALVPVDGVPMLGRVIMKLRDAGIPKIYVNVHHFASQIYDYLRDNNNFGVEIVVSDETGLLLETGGAIVRCAGPLLADGTPLLIHNSDVLTDFDITEMESHLGASDALMMVQKRKSSRQLLFDGHMEMRGWHNTETGEFRPDASAAKPDLEQYAFSGVHIITPRFILALKEYNAGLIQSGRAKAVAADGTVPFPIMDFYVDACRHMDFRGYLPEGEYRWFDIGKPGTLREACTAFSKI